MLPMANCNDLGGAAGREPINRGFFTSRITSRCVQNDAFDPPMKGFVGSGWQLLRSLTRAEKLLDPGRMIEESSAAELLQRLMATKPGINTSTDTGTNRISPQARVIFLYGLSSAVSSRGGRRRNLPR